MKIICVFTAAFLISVSCVAQQAKVVVFKHELRWTDENRFPNYFHVPAIRDSVFGETKLELMNYLKVSDVKLPQNVDYRVINGFGK